MKAELLSVILAASIGIESKHFLAQQVSTLSLILSKLPWKSSFFISKKVLKEITEKRESNWMWVVVANYFWRPSSFTLLINLKKCFITLLRNKP